jgi:hypothetical protein
MSNVHDCITLLRLRTSNAKHLARASVSIHILTELRIKTANRKKTTAMTRH